MRNVWWLQRGTEGKDEIEGRGGPARRLLMASIEMITVLPDPKEFLGKC